MKPKHKRMAIYGSGLVLLALAVALILAALEENIVFFRSPSEVIAKEVPAERRFRLGGLVVDGSVERANGSPTIVFALTDGAETVPVSYTGILPDLFREGQGVVAEGKLDGNGVFVATEVLAKHDETYMPPEVADALKKAGHWKGGDSP
ncbi:MAG: cytochrome c maturation protein CcmE [Alphaproteobacteria bacterium]|nr:cytochrome c maturation protein CcmE [Alphaproteobacteria bacterium]